MARTKSKINRRLAALDDKSSGSSRTSPMNPFEDDDGPVMDTTAFTMVVVLVFAILTTLAVVFGIQKIEDDLERRADRALRSQGIEGVEVVAVGQDVQLTGVVLEEDHKTLVPQIVNRVRGVRNVPAPNIEWVPRPTIEEVTVVSDPLMVAWVGSSVVISGTLSDQATVDSVLEVVNDTWTVVDAEGLTVLEGLEPERDWLPSILSLAVEMAARDDEGEVVANPSAGVVKVSAEFDTRQEQREAKDKAEDILATVTFAFSSGLTVKDAPRPTLRAVEQLQEDIDELILGQVVEFEDNSAELTLAGRELLDVVFAAISDFPTVPVEIAGHTDDRGSLEYNLDLSQRRADAVLAYLVGLGADANRFVVVAFGEEKPVADNSTPEGRARNRRIEFTALEE